MRKATRAAFGVIALASVLATAGPARAADDRAAARASGGDRAVALRVAQALLARPLDVQLMHVRCERVGARRFCGLTLSGVHFHRWIDTAVFLQEVDALVRGAFATDPAIAEVDLWTIVPADAGRGAVVSGDFARPAAATVYATSVARGRDPNAAANTFWDAQFRRDLDRGTAG